MLHITVNPQDHEFALKLSQLLGSGDFVLKGNQIFENAVYIKWFAELADRFKNAQPLPTQMPAVETPGDKRAKWK